MVSFGDLRSAEPGRFEKAAENWSDHADRLSHHADDLDGKIDELEGWQGQAADAARAHFRRLHDQFTEAAGTMGQIPPILLELTDRTTTARDQLLEAIRQAEETGISVHPDGALSGPSRGPGHQGGRWDDHFAKAERLREELAAAIRASVTAATEADEAAKANLAELMPAVVGLSPQALGAGEPYPRESIPAPGTDPAEVKDWWDSLTATERESLIYGDADLVGSLDGVPIEARDRANRAILEEQLAVLTARRDQLEALGDLGSNQQAELDEIIGKIGGLNAVDERLRNPEPGEQDAYLVLIDSEGSGRAVVAAGNPDTADNVVTSVPGTGANLSGVHGLLDRSDLLVHASGLADKEATTAAVTWLGYDAPPDLVHAAGGSYAEGATSSLQRFQEGLRVTHEGSGSHNTILGHSYGSTAVGYAGRSGGGLDVDSMIFVGSPGVGVDHASELGIPPENVHSGLAQNDLIKVAAWAVHGPDPTSDDFGGQTFYTEAGTSGSWISGGLSGSAHSEYWDEGSDSLRNMGRIVVGDG